MDPDALNRLATEHYRSGNLRMAVNALTTALKLDPDHVDSHLNVASLLLEASQFDLAEMHADRALELAPRRYEAVLGVGLIHRVRERSGEAIEWLSKAEAIAPSRIEAPMALGTTYQEMGMPVEAIAAFDRALAWHPSNADLLSNRLFTTNFLPSFDPRASLALHRDYERKIRIPRTVLSPLLWMKAANDASFSPAVPEQRLRIGYVSGDLRHHAVARFLLPVLRQRDRERFHVTGYYTGRIVDAVTREIAGLCDDFRQVASIGDEALLKQIAADAIDVLVDCSGHSAGNRLPVFAARAAPSQVSWLGYLGSTGLSTIDARITDAFADPEGLGEAFHVEPLIRLPSTMWAYEPYPDAPDPVRVRASEAGLASASSIAPSPPSATGAFDRAITFGALSNPSKLSDAALAAWAEILSAIPSSRLAMTVRNDSALRERILRPFAERSIDPSRIELLSRMSTREYLDAYARIDIALDTFPVSGGTTVCDALWQGVPVLVVRSVRPYGATAASVLHQVGMDDWVCGSPQQLVERAIAIARTPFDALPRAALRERMRTSPLLDAAGVARAIEAAFNAVANR